MQNIFDALGATRNIIL
jgi:hypothetical protein